MVLTNNKSTFSCTTYSYVNYTTYGLLMNLCQRKLQFEVIRHDFL